MNLILKIFYFLLLVNKHFTRTILTQYIQFSKKCEEKETKGLDPIIRTDATTPIQVGRSKSFDRLTGNWNPYCLTINSSVPVTHLSACGDTITSLFSPISLLTLILRGLPNS